MEEKSQKLSQKIYNATNYVQVCGLNISDYVQFIYIYIYIYIYTKIYIYGE